MHFIVKVSCYGSKWLIYVPAFGVTRIVADKTAIRAEARKAIAQCGAAPKMFDIDLELGRVIDDK
ncbi:hypothetical protein ACH474_33965 [Nocardia rhamnosiphila]|uniref:hypothetical protein n=1 Tax=Nocardia rhamnosiphila TaxID=426716 RepID=UPI00379B0603